MLKLVATKLFYKIMHFSLLRRWSQKLIYIIRNSMYHYIGNHQKPRLLHFCLATCICIIAQEKDNIQVHILVCLVCQLINVKFFIFRFHSRSICLPSVSGYWKTDCSFFSNPHREWRVYSSTEVEFWSTIFRLEL